MPIEPIISFKINSKGLIDVHSGVLDLSFKGWKNIGGNFINELSDDMYKIESVLKKNHVEHGHPHGCNFCLRFWRDSNGNVDFTKKPRIYLIDFDAARS